MSIKCKKHLRLNCGYDILVSLVHGIECTTNINTMTKIIHVPNNHFISIFNFKPEIGIIFLLFCHSLAYKLRLFFCKYLFPLNYHANMFLPRVYIYIYIYIYNLIKLHADGVNHSRVSNTTSTQCSSVFIIHFTYQLSI